MRAVFLPSLCFALILPCRLVAEAPLVAVRGATLHPISGPAIENGVLIVEDGKIKALGSGLAIPAGATIVEAAGRHLYPGFVHPDSTLGLVEIDSVRGSVDLQELDGNNADLRAEVAFNADSLRLLPTVAGGVTSAHISQNGGLFTGNSAVMRLAGWNHEDMTLKTGVGVHLKFPALPSHDADLEASALEEAKKEREKALKQLDDTLDDARAYAKAKSAGSPGLAVNLKLEALIDLIEGRDTLFLRCDRKAQIEAALDWAKKQNLTKLVLVAGADAAYLAERLATEKVPVILDGVLALPQRDWEPYDSAYTAAARLHQAGVRFAISDSGESSNARNLPFHAAMAAAFGLPKEEALRSVTLSAAEILGVADAVGSLEPGKEANFFLASGDPLEIVTTIERVWIAGQEVDLFADHQRRLYEKYKNRPRPNGTR